MAAKKKADGKAASIATLKKRAQGGEASAFEALVERTKSSDQDVVIEACNAIGTVRTKAAYEALAAMVLESPNKGLQFVAMTQLDKALKKDKTIVEILIRICEDPRTLEQDYPITLLSNLAYSNAEHAKNPRILKCLRRAIGSSHPYAVEAAIGTLAKIKDVQSLPAIMATLDNEERGPDQISMVADAIEKLGGGEAELEKLRAMRAKAVRHEIGVLDRVLERLEKKLKR